MNGAVAHASRLGARLPRLAVGVMSAASGVFGFVLVLGWAGGSIATDDLWWHLSLGELYAQVGPRLDGDPRLHTALTAPHPNAWLFDRSLLEIVENAGLSALRAFHALFVLGTVAAVWQLLRRTSASTTWAVTGSVLFLALAEHRLAQLRPELATIALGVGLTALVFWPGPPPGRLRSVLALALVGLWPHLHPGFPLGVVLLGAGAAAAALDGLGRSPDTRSPPSDDRRAHLSRSLGLAGLAGAAVCLTWLHPSGLEAWEAYVAAGRDATRDAIIVDEWRAFHPLALPGGDLPPSTAAWGTWWLVAVVCAALAAPLLWKRSVPEAPGGWVGLGLAFAGLLAPLVAVRFLWLGFLSLIWIGAQLGPRLRNHAARSVIVAFLGAGVVLALSFDERGGGRGLRWPTETLAAPTYDADRYYAHALWLLADARVEGRLFHPYFVGGFAGYWLGSSMTTFADGSLNFPQQVLMDHASILQDRPKQSAAVDATEILDRYGIDAFVGVGLPVTPRPGRPWRYSSTLLEDDPRWIPVYRGMRSAVYLRRGPRNDANLDRVARFYAQRGVPFDREVGFRVIDVLERSPGWAIENGVAPIDLARLRRDLDSDLPGPRLRARERLAWTWGVLGEYEAAWALAAQEAARSSDAMPLGRLWLALKLDRREDALRVAETLRRSNPSEGADLERAVRAWAAEPNAQARARRARRFVPLDRRAASRLAATERKAEVRPASRREPIPPTRYSGSQSSRKPTPKR